MGEILLILLFIPIFFVLWEIAKLIMLVSIIMKEAGASSQKLPYLLFLPGHILLRWKYFFTTEWGPEKNTVQTSRQLRKQEFFAPLLSIPCYVLIFLTIILMATDNQYKSFFINVANFLRGFYGEILKDVF